MHETEYLSSSEQSIGLFYLSRTRRPSLPGGWVYDVFIDGALLMSSVSPLSERELATQALEAHQGTRPLRILIGGLGLGYTAQAALEDPQSAQVRVVDPMDFVAGWLQDGLLPLSEQLNSDPRLEIVQRDIYADLLGPASETWDLILVDVDHSPDSPLDPSSLDFYTEAGQARVREHLAPGGVLAVWSASDSDAFAGVLERAYPKAWRRDVDWIVEDDGQHLHNVLFFADRDARPAA